MSGVADDIKRHAAAWLEQHDSGDWSDEDRTQFDAWLNTSADHRVEFLRVQAAWDRSERLSVLRSADIGETASRSRMIGKKIFGVVAALAVIAAIGWGTKAYLSRENYTTYATTVGGHETLALDDRTKIELNTDTTIRVSDDAQERKVILDKGEAYFQVTHNAARPFVVLVGDSRVTDLGTKFFIRRDSTKLEIGVMEGRAGFESADQAKPTILSPGEVAVANGDSIAVKKSSQTAIKNALEWRRGVLVFENATLAQAAAELNRYNHEKLVIADSAAAKLTFGATLPTTDVNAFTEVAKEVLGLRVEKRGDAIVISR
ncbi:MAG TPA: FecR domain-containing protein [Rhizomicrobium sp.]|jgi:transmembrane sensor|nr:FecR domain-containing protein [Rhizomicrobium sp.]